LGGGTPPLVINQTISRFFVVEGFPKLKLIYEVSNFPPHMSVMMSQELINKIHLGTPFFEGRKLENPYYLYKWSAARQF
jgi:hypothetical protein